MQGLFNGEKFPGVHPQENGEPISEETEPCVCEFWGKEACGVCKAKQVPDYCEDDSSRYAWVYFIPDLRVEGVPSEVVVV